MNFENAPVATVAKAILGDIPGVGYTIDPRVQATVSLSSGRPVSRKDILYVFESALRVSNVALVREPRGYRLVPIAEAPGTGAIDGTEGLEAGYGITAVPLQFVSAPTLTKLLENFAAKPGMVRADPSRNLVLIQGNAADRRAAIDTVLSFDADWMRGQSVGIYPLINSTPEPIIGELDNIIDSGEGGLSQSVVKLQAINRQNAVLVVSRKPEFLRTVSTWITRLDKSGGAGSGVRVYRMRYGDARQAAELLNDMFVGGGSGSTLDNPMNQLVPGGGAIASGSRRPSLLGNTQLGAGLSQSRMPNPLAGSQNAPADFETRYADASGGAASLARNLAQGSGAGPSSPNGRAGSANGATPFLPGVRIAADPINNTLLIYANPENYRVIAQTLQQIDRPQLQVAIDATIAEVTLNNKLNYGVQFFLKSSDVGLGTDKGSIINSIGSGLLAQTFPGFNFLIGSQAQPRLILDALHQVTDVKVLSNPSVVVLDNQVATLQVGDQIPITTGTATVLNSSNQVVSTIDYRPTGNILRVVPRVNVNGNVVLDIEQEVSNVTNPDNPTLTPTVSQRRVKSSIAVASGQTVLLAGLISEQRTNERSGIPLLDQLPNLGEAFGHQNRSAGRTELIMFIRPQVIRDGADARRVAEELRNKMPAFAPPPPLVTKAPR
jgi:general secretion pathway protein D